MGVALRFRWGEVTTHWPALQQLAQQGMSNPGRAAAGALGQWQGKRRRPGPGCSAPLLWLGWLQQADPVQGSEQRKKWQRSLGITPLLAGSAGAVGGRSPRPGGRPVRYPATAAGGAPLGLPLARSLRPGAPRRTEPQVTILHKWDLSHVLDAEPRHRLMAFCQDLLRLLLGREVAHWPLRALRPAQGEEGMPPGRKARPRLGKLAQLAAGVGTLEAGAQAPGAAGLAAPRGGPELGVQDPEAEHQGEWTAGRRVDPALLSTQYASLLDEADWALVRTLPRNMGKLPGMPGCPWQTILASSMPGAELQLAVSALLQLVQSGEGMSARLHPAPAARGAHIVPWLRICGSLF